MTCSTGFHRGDIGDTQCIHSLKFDLEPAVGRGDAPIELPVVESLRRRRVEEVTWQSNVSSVVDARRDEPPSVEGGFGFLHDRLR